MDIIPAILTDDPRELDEWLRKIKNNGGFDRVQVDFVDGKYNDNLTIKPSEADLIPFFPLKFDAHLMVTEDNVLVWSKTAEKMGFERVIVQAESISHPEEYTGLALDVHSPVTVIEPYLKQLEVVILMAVEPGFGGQSFNHEVIEKIERISRLREQSKSKFRICVDGGVEKEHLEELGKVGADEVAVGVRRVLEW